MSRGYNATNITAAGTITVATGPMFLKRVVVNKPGAAATVAPANGSAALGKITCPATITSADPFFLDYDVACDNGLTVVTTGTLDSTVVWGPQGEES